MEPRRTSLAFKLAEFITRTKFQDIPNTTIHRSKRMILDCLGNGIIGSQTDISKTLRTLTKMEYPLGGNSRIWGTAGETTTLTKAAFLNGVSAHSMDFDDVWHPATRPTAPLLPCVIALVGQEDGNHAYSSRDLLTSFNVGIQVQGLLLRCSKLAQKFPTRFHPPGVYGVMGSVAAASNLLRLSESQTVHALAIAAMFAGAPLANAGTATKPLHCGNAARFGIEAALMAKHGVQGSKEILDSPSGFAAFFDDFDPDLLLSNIDVGDFLLEHQDVGIKSYPTHIGMHYAIDAALNVRQKASVRVVDEFLNAILKVEISVPESKYVDRSIPETEHAARHSFQFNACTAILDGHVGVASYQDDKRNRQELSSLLEKTTLVSEKQNVACLETMYVEVCVYLKDGGKFSHRCIAPLGHWNKPLSDEQVEKKFIKNAETVGKSKRDRIVRLVWDLDKEFPATDLVGLL